MMEKHTITMTDGTKVHVTVSNKSMMGPFVDLVIDGVERPKKPEYRYTKVGLPHVQHSSTIAFWRKNKDGLDIFLRLVRYVGNDGRKATALVMCDGTGEMLESGCLLKFDEETGSVDCVPMVSDQYPGLLNDGSWASEYMGAMMIGLLPIQKDPA